MRIIVEDPQGNEIIQSDELELDLINYERYRANVGLKGIEINEPGFHWFLIQQQESPDTGWETVQRLPIDVKRKHVEKEESSSNEASTN